MSLDRRIEKLQQLKPQIYVDARKIGIDTEALGQAFRILRGLKPNRHQHVALARQYISLMGLPEALTSDEDPTE